MSSYLLDITLAGVNPGGEIAAFCVDKYAHLAAPEDLAALAHVPRLTLLTPAQLRECGVDAMTLEEAKARDDNPPLRRH